MNGYLNVALHAVVRTGGRVPALAAVLLPVTVLCCILPGSADDWPSFRGPTNDGISMESDWVAQWDEGGPKIDWRHDVGVGASSVVVVGERVVAMGSHQDRNEDVVSCLDVSSGTVLWQYAYSSLFDARQFEGGSAATPAVDGQLVYTVGYLGQVYCLRLESGEVVWSKHLVDDFGGRYSSWKYAGSPLVVDDYLVLDTGSDGNSTIALDKATGQKVWGTGDDLAGYATPIPFKYVDQKAVLVFKARAMVAYELATGTELWRIDWRTYYDCNASTPTVKGDKLFISTGYGGRSARGALYQMDQEQPRQLWLNQDIETKMNSAVLYQGYIYCVSERAGGQLMCCSMEDGSVMWSESSFARYGTLMIAGGRLVILDEQGALVIVKATPDAYRELARAQVVSGRCWAMPVLANGRIYAKTNGGSLVCVDVRSESGK